jgi:hypothetical protein
MRESQVKGLRISPSPIKTIQKASAQMLGLLFWQEPPIKSNRKKTL